ncbi:hypothetical protein [Brevibacillus brevis]|uniref:hypothetical protein n=1 Tax=Brevibacillus brevis TaxID=1393 RepID=UPI00165DE494|nr:hypothetical protein [Brevibacillus brevis]
MGLEMQLKQLCKGDIQIESINLEEMSVDVLLPYESASTSVELEGENDEEIIESFKSEVNKRLNDMIDHLNDCKLY